MSQSSARINRANLRRVMTPSALRSSTLFCAHRLQVAQTPSLSDTHHHASPQDTTTLRDPALAHPDTRDPSST